MKSQGKYSLYARQAITTRFHGPTNTRGSRYSATADAGRVYSHADDALDSLGNHLKAAAQLCAKFDWQGKLAAGALVNGAGYVWVFVEDDTTTTI
jgi:hypothetical protein